MGLGEAASYLKKVIRPSMVTATNKMQININILAGSSKINLTFFDGIFSLQLYVAVKPWSTAYKFLGQAAMSRVYETTKPPLPLTGHSPALSISWT